MFLLVLLACLIAATHTIAHHKRAELERGQNPNLPFEIATPNGPTVRWRYDTVNNSLAIELTSQNFMSQGWLGIGFPQAQAKLGNMMIGSDAVIGVLDPAGNSYLANMLLAAKVNHNPLRWTMTYY